MKQGRQIGERDLALSFSTDLAEHSDAVAVLAQLLEAPAEPQVGACKTGRPLAPDRAVFQLVEDSEVVYTFHASGLVQYILIMLRLRTGEILALTFSDLRLKRDSLVSDLKRDKPR